MKVILDDVDMDVIPIQGVPVKVLKLVDKQSKIEYQVPMTLDIVAELVKRLQGNQIMVAGGNLPPPPADLFRKSGQNGS